jgi:hypothetical protein
MPEPFKDHFKQVGAELREKALPLLHNAIQAVRDGNKRFTPRTVHSLKNMVSAIGDLDPDNNQPLEEALSELLGLLPEDVK